MTRKLGLIGPLLGAVLICPAPVRAQGAGTTMTDLARIREGMHSERVSSWDRTGGR